MISTPADARNYSVQHTFTTTAALKAVTTRSDWERRRGELLEQLEEQLFRWFPTEPPAFETLTLRNSGGYMPRYVDYRDHSFQSESGVRVRVQLLSPKNGAGDRPLLIYVKRPGDSIYAMDMDELLPLLGRFTVVILNPRLTELDLGSGEYADVERTAVWVGRTIATMRLWDIRRTIDWVLEDRRLQPTAISIYGKGEMGILALYAGVMDSRVDTVILSEPPGSHRQGPAPRVVRNASGKQQIPSRSRAATGLGASRGKVVRSEEFEQS